MINMSKNTRKIQVIDFPIYVDMGTRLLAYTVMMSSQIRLDSKPNEQKIILK